MIQLPVFLRIVKRTSMFPLPYVHESNPYIFCCSNLISRDILLKR